jgi:hypothetical protein
MEMKNVYSAVRTGSLNKAVCALSFKVYTVILRRKGNVCRARKLYFIFFISNKYNEMSPFMLLKTMSKFKTHSHLKEESLDRTMWRPRFGKGLGAVVRQITK